MSKASRTPMFLTGGLLLVVTALVWIMALREGDRRGLVLEYEAFKASAALAEELRRGDPSSIDVQDSRVLGFGLYDLAGNAMRVFGAAPGKLAARDIPSLRGHVGEGAFSGAQELRSERRASSVIIYRFLGPQSVARQMMQGDSMPGQMRNQVWRRQGGGAATALPSTPQAALPIYLLWLEYDAGGAIIEGAVYIGIAATVSAALAALFAVLIRLFSRNERLRERESQTRELIQLGEAARTLVHEIKNPLGIMRIQTANIRRHIGGLGSADPDPSVSLKAIGASAVHIDTEIRRLSGLADRIREFLKAGEGRLDPVRLGDFLSDFWERYKGAEGADGAIRLDMAPDSADAVAAIDHERLTLALDNLVRNALEANAEAGGQDREVVLGLEGRGRDWAISVADSGFGIPAGMAEKIFEPFFTTKKKGTGIGLSLARRIAEGASGSLVYAAGPGGGSVFTICLPRATQVRESSRTPS